jgi:hypothetical protein
MSRMNTREPIAKVSRKLFLNRETVRSLSAAETLEEVAGGGQGLSLLFCSYMHCWTTG